MPDNYGQQFVGGTTPSSGQWITAVSAPEAPRILLLDEAIQSIEGSTKYVYEVAEQVRGIADSILGVIAQPGNPEKQSRPVPSGRAGGLKNGTTELSLALAVLHGEVNRLRAL